MTEQRETMDLIIRVTVDAPKELVACHLFTDSAKAELEEYCQEFDRRWVGTSQRGQRGTIRSCEVLWPEDLSDLIVRMMKEDNWPYQAAASDIYLEMEARLHDKVEGSLVR